jgi:hypothetical protein
MINANIPSMCLFVCVKLVLPNMRPMQQKHPIAVQQRIGTTYCLNTNARNITRSDVDLVNHQTSSATRLRKPEQWRQGFKLWNYEMQKNRKHMRRRIVNAPLRHLLDIVGRLLEDLLDTCWTLVGHCLDTLGHCLDMFLHVFDTCLTLVDIC